MLNDDHANQYTCAIVAGPICAMLGLNWSDVIQRAGLGHTDPQKSGFLVSADTFIRIWNAAIELAGSDGIAKQLGLRMARGPAIPVLFAISSAPNFETGVKRMARFKHLFGPMRFAISENRTEFRLLVVPDSAHMMLPDTLSSGQIVFLHAKATALATRPFEPRAVFLPLSEKERNDLEELFGVVPQYGSAAIHYNAADVTIPFISQNDELWAATEQDLQTQAQISSGDSPMTNRVRATLLEAFGATEPTMDHVSTRLKTSRSTLTRRLRDEGTSFQALLDTTRQVLATRYLRTSTMTNQQIASVLGYKDTSAFQRAFRKWTGQTPHQIRRGFPDRPHASASSI